MKSLITHLSRFFAALLLGGLLITACSDSPSGIDPVDLTVNVTFSEGYESSEANGAEMTLTNVNSQETFEAIVDANGEASFQELPSGNYDISVVLTLSRDKVFDLSGTYPDADEVIFNGSISDITINPDIENPIVELTTGRLGDLVIKQVYYSGSDVIDGALFRDQFIEIANNSNEAINVSGLYIMGAYGENNNDIESNETENGQLDWSQSIGMPSDINPNEDYLYGRWIYQIPDNGAERMLEPGKSIVIAQTALNHKEPFTDNDGESVSVNDPSLTVDLSGADFEVYLGDELDNPFATDIDNPNVPDLRSIFIFGRDMVLDTHSWDAYVIFRTDVEADEFEAYPSPQERNIDNETTFYPQIPTEWVIDAVQAQPSPSNQIPPKLQTRLDAGYAYTPGGIFSSQSIIRITAKQSDGRNILKDTNNSQEDFTFLERAEPRVAAPLSSNGSSSRMLMKAPNNKYDNYFEQLKSRWAPGINR